MDIGEITEGIMIMVVGLTVVFILLFLLVIFMALIQRLSRVPARTETSLEVKPGAQEEVAAAIGLALHEHLFLKGRVMSPVASPRLNAWKMSGWIWQQQSKTRESW
ncbi:MAG: OadG family protein [Deltaproteobacteria bacterium]|nr:MAG: OadG family protein [Deltaproteobacteria bacterium]